MAVPAQFIWGPATFVVLLIVGLLIVLGALLLGSSRKEPREAPDEHACQRCGHADPANAKFCSRCGHDLQERDTRSTE